MELTMITSAKFSGEHVGQRLQNRLGVNIDPTKTYILNLENAIYVQKYKHYIHNTTMIDYVVMLAKIPVVIAVDIATGMVYSVMTEGKKVDICFKKAAVILQKLKRNDALTLALV
tara:strand:- start:356 stop:700 length:345 start_codon:yes stop_codon:yes gene_type:complete